MKFSWFLVVLLLVIVAIFSVQNADAISVRFLAWQINMSAALVIQLAALLGGLVGLTAGVCSRHSRNRTTKAFSVETPRDPAEQANTAPPQASTTRHS